MAVVTVLLQVVTVLYHCDNCSVAGSHCICITVVTVVLLQVVIVSV